MTKIQRQVFLAVFASLVLGFFLLLATSDPSASTSVVRSQWSVQDVRVGCQARVTQELLSPRSLQLGGDFFDTDPRWSPTAKSWTWSFGLESSNAFGVMLPSRWQCDITGDEFISVTQLR